MLKILIFCFVPIFGAESCSKETHCGQNLSNLLKWKNTDLNPNVKIGNGNFGRGLFRVAKNKY